MPGLNPVAETRKLGTFAASAGIFILGGGVPLNGTVPRDPPNPPKPSSPEPSRASRASHRCALANLRGYSIKTTPPAFPVYLVVDAELM